MFATVVVEVTKNTSGELILPELFCTVHQLSLSLSLSLHWSIFRWSCLEFKCCQVVRSLHRRGIVELTSCTHILRPPIGGHVWYDVTLHAAVLAVLPDF